MYGVRPIHQGWHNALGELISSAREQLTIAAPFITSQGAHSICEKINPHLRDHGKLDILTDMSPAHVCDGAIEPAAVEHMMNAVSGASLWHVPRFHAKVYLADRDRAIVTSGNLTSGAFFRNVEYGLEIADREVLAVIGADLEDFRLLGVTIGAGQLAEYVGVANQVRETFQRQQTTVDPALRRAFLNAIQTAEGELIRFRLAGGAMHTVFAKTIVFLLRKYGPLPTTAIHEYIQNLHPDLCDDSVDRVIDGKRYGKKWKHAVRTAQQQNKGLQLIDNDGELWHIVNGA